MSPEAENMFVEDIAPRVRIASRCLPQVGADDADELHADGIAIAAEMLTSAEKRGKEVTAGNIAWYVKNSSLWAAEADMGDAQTRSARLRSSMTGAA